MRRSGSILLVAALIAFAIWMLRPPQRIPAPIFSRGIDEKLEQVLPEFSVTRPSLEAVIADLSQRGGIEMVVDPMAVQMTSKNSRLFKMTFQNDTICEILNSLMRSIDPRIPITWRVIGEKVHVVPSGLALKDDEPILRSYDVSALLREAADVRLRRQSMNAVTRP